MLNIYDVNLYCRPFHKKKQTYSKIRFGCQANTLRVNTALNFSRYHSVWELDIGRSVLGNSGLCTLTCRLKLIHIEDFDNKYALCLLLLQYIDTPLCLPQLYKPKLKHLNLMQRYFYPPLLQDTFKQHGSMFGRGLTKVHSLLGILQSFDCQNVTKVCSHLMASIS